MTAPRPPGRGLGWLAATCALGTAGLGFLALGTWVLGIERHASFGPGYVPMAPDTALLLLLLGLAAASGQCGPQLRSTRLLARVAVGLALGAGVLVIAKWSGLAPLPWDGILVPPTEPVGDIPLGQMSPITAGTILLSALGLLPWVLGSGFPRPLRWLVLGSSAAGLIVGAIVVLDYTMGTPFFYGAATVPMAWLTAVGFVLLNISLLLLQGRGFGRSDGPLPPGGEERVSTGSSAGWLPPALMLALVFAFALAGFSFLKREQAVARDEILRNLNAISDLKVGQIDSWRRERLSEGDFLLRAPFAAQDVAALLADPGAVAARAAVSGWLSLIKGGDRYERAVVLDAAGRARLSLPESAPAPTPRLRALAAATLREGRVFLSDLHRAEPGDGIHLDLLVPILPPGHQPARDGKPGAGPALPAPIAVIALRLDPTQFLFPLVRTWPTSSPTAETFLIHRDGDDVVYLTDLRHRPNAALNLRRPLSDPDLLAAQVLRGRKTMIEGLDYRGARVLTAVRAVPDSPWVMMAKIDQAEAYAPLRATARRTGLVVALGLATLALAAVHLWRRRNYDLLERELQLQRERNTLAERLSVLTRHANDSILLLDDTGRIIEANERALATYGYTLEEIRSLPSGGLRTPAAQEEFPAQIALLCSVEGAVFETIHQRKDGSTFPVEVSGRAVEIEGRPFSLGIYRDLTQRKAHEAEIEHLNRLYAALSQVNQVIVRVTTRETLFQEVCRVLVEFGGFRLARIGWVDPSTAAVQLISQAGDTTGYLQDIRVFADDRPEGRGPTGTCIRTGTTYVCGDFATDPNTGPWREAAARAGIAASIALPIREAGVVRGALTVYAAEKNAFGRKEIALLEEAAADLAFGIDHLEADRQRRASEAALRASEAKFHALFDHGIDGILLTIPDGMILAANPAACRLLGRTEEEIRRTGRSGLVDTSDPRLPLLLEERARSGRTQGGLTLIRGDGLRFEADISSVVFQTADGPRTSMVIRDISEQKRAERALAESEHRYQVLAEVSPAGIFRTDAQGQTTYVNPRWCQMTGLRAADAMGEGWQHAVHPDDRAKVIAGWRQATAVHGASSMDYRFLHADGTVVWVMGQAVPETDLDGRVVGYVGTLIDVTERRRSEAVLQEQLDELHRWQDAMLGREHRVLHVKAEVNALLHRLGEPPRYPSAQQEWEPSRNQ